MKEDTLNARTDLPIRLKVEKDIDDFIARGGRVELIPRGVSAENLKVEKRKYKSSFKYVYQDEKRAFKNFKINNKDNFDA